MDNSTTYAQVLRGQASTALPTPTDLPLHVLLRQPMDLMSMFWDLLPVESIAALTLTCKGLFHHLPSAILSSDPEARRRFLKLLERDLGQRLYYCHDCNQLHQYDQNWTLLNEGNDVASWTRKWDHCYNKHNATISAVGIDLPYRYLRLVMNSHFLGSDNGLPLSSLALTLRQPATFDAPIAWETTWTARVIDDQLFLHAKHSLESQVGRHPETLRRGLDKKAHRICSHIRTGAAKMWPAGRNPSRLAYFKKQAFKTENSLVPCEDKSDSCMDCLTDCSLSILPVGDIDEPTACSVVINSYHQLGDGRFPYNWAWQQFTGAPPSENADGTTEARDLNKCDRGAVMKKWIKAEEGEKRRPGN